MDKEPSLFAQAVSNVTNIVLAALCVGIPLALGCGLYYIFGPAGTDWFRIG